MAQVAVQGPSEAPIWVQGATASGWYEVGTATVYSCGTRYMHFTYQLCVCVPFDAMHSGTQSLSKGKSDSEYTAFSAKVLLSALQPPRADKVDK